MKEDKNNLIDLIILFLIFFKIIFIFIAINNSNCLKFYPFISFYIFKISVTLIEVCISAF